MVYTIGEVVLDIIFRTFDNVKVKPGGSMLNTAVSLGRLGVNVSHISTLSTDKASGQLINFLKKNSVQTIFINRTSAIKTSLALAYLDENSNADYTFYKDKLESSELLKFPDVLNADIIHYGSFFSINEAVHKQLYDFLGKANKSGCIKLYDPNFRKPHLAKLKSLMPMVENNFKMADIVKGSDEDFENIFDVKSGKDTWKLMKSYGVKVLFYTKGKYGSELYTDRGVLNIETKNIKAISTIGAGDTYSAAIIYFLSSQLTANNNLSDITIEQWGICINIAHEFSAHTCQSLDNYLSKEYCDSLLKGE